MDDLREIPRRHPSPGLGPTGTMDGKEGADLLQVVHPRVAVPVHDDDGVPTRALQDVLDEAARRGISGVRPVRRGEQLLLPPA